MNPLPMIRSPKIQVAYPVFFDPREICYLKKPKSFPEVTVPLGSASLRNRGSSPLGRTTGKTADFAWKKLQNRLPCCSPRAGRNCRWRAISLGCIWRRMWVVRSCLPGAYFLKPLHRSQVLLNKKGVLLWTNPSKGEHLYSVSWIPIL